MKAAGASALPESGRIDETTHLLLQVEPDMPVLRDMLDVATAADMSGGRLATPCNVLRAWLARLLGLGRLQGRCQLSSEPDSMWTAMARTRLPRNSSISTFLA